LANTWTGLEPDEYTVVVRDTADHDNYLTVGVTVWNDVPQLTLELDESAAALKWTASKISEEMPPRSPRSRSTA
jgi:hypothetical protein